MEGDEQPQLPGPHPPAGPSRRGGRSRGRARGILLETEDEVGIGIPHPGSPGRPLEARVVDLRLSSGNGSGALGDGNGGNGQHSPGSPNGNGNGGGVGVGSARGGLAATAEAGPSTATRPLLTEEMFDIIDPGFYDSAKKKGIEGQPLDLRANYFPTKKVAEFDLFQYRVDFLPQEDRTYAKKKMMAPLYGQGEGKFGIPFIFDGHSLFTTRRLEDQYLQMTITYEGNPVQITIRHIATLPDGDILYVNFFNILVRKCMDILGLTLMGRNYFDPAGRIVLPQQRLELWPGFITTLRHHDAGLIYCVEITHKVIRMDTVWDYIKNARTELEQKGMRLLDDIKMEISRRLIGTIVMTTYNRLTYRVDDIKWNETPEGTFKNKSGEETTYVDYYLNKRNLTITNNRQPLIASNPKARDARRGRTDPFLLIPEFCVMTGLSDEMRANFGLMRELSGHMFQPPLKKMNSTIDFVRRLRGNLDIKKEFDEWGVQIGPNPIKVPGRQLPKESILFYNSRKPEEPVKFPVNEQADFTMAFRNSLMNTSVPLERWVVILPARDDQNLSNLVQTMQRVSGTLGFTISNFMDKTMLQSTTPQQYSDAVQKMYEKYADKLQLMFVVLPNNKLEAYAAVKRKCYVDYGVSSQCFLTKNMTVKSLMSIATKVVVQMNAKLGGIPWQLNIPLKRTMIIGFDVYHGGMGSNNRSVGAMVATTNDTFTKYFSCVSMFAGREELSMNIAQDVGKCAKANGLENGKKMPDRIFLYRDGVGEGQLHYVFTVELVTVKNQLFALYEKFNQENPPMITFIVNTKRINTRFFRQNKRGEFENPPPGTIVDSDVTMPNRWDFFLVAQQARQGVVSPTHYNVIFDSNELDANKIQRLTYKLCHLYYNWSGAVAVPAVCQYSHKLAYLTGMATQSENSNILAHKLYFL